MHSLSATTTVSSRGVEPLQTESKSVVLPLHQKEIFHTTLHQLTLPDIALGYLPALGRLIRTYKFGPLPQPCEPHPLSVDATLVVQGGIEPPTSGFSDRRSTSELLHQINFEPNYGIEPYSPAYRAGHQPAMFIGPKKTDPGRR